MDFQAQFEEESKHKIKKKVKKRNRICTAQSYDIKLLHMAIKFFECSLCPSTSFNTLQALQKHVVTHKDRVTSWDLRAKGLLTKKKKKKSKKSKNKEGTSESTESTIKGTENTIIGTESTVKGAESTVEGVKSIEDSSANQEKEKQVSSDVANAINKNLEKIYKCGGCGKQFTLGYYLKLHVRSHTGEKPYICQECGLSFITASKLNRHRKQLHLSRKECRICRCPFSNMDLLRAHFHLHHGDCIIDGEPYDFNAILPYLKETEHELQMKNEEEKKLKKLENTIIKQEVCKIEYENKPTPPPIVKTELNEVPNVEPVQTSPIQENTDHPIWDSFTSFCSWENQEQVSSKEVEVELEVPGKVELEVPGKVEVEVPGNVNVKTEIVKDNDGFDNDNESSDEYFGEGTWTEPLVEIENSDDEPIINIKRNRKKKINKSTLVPCEVCKKEIRHGYMVIHMRSHTKERPFKCDKCDKAFITNGKLMEHGLTHMRCDDEIVQEDIKPKIEVKYENDSEIDSSKPKKIKKEVKRRSYKCPKCEEIFEFQTLLKTHLKIHKKPKTFKCNYCLQDCHDQETLSEHEKQHGGPKPYVCTICGRNYTKKFSMIYHRKTHDPDVTNSHTCTACNRSFDTQRKLARHFLVHRPSKVVLRYECPVCAHIFNTRHHVEMHLRSHEREGVIVPENRGQILAMVLQNTRKIPLETDSTSNLTHLLPNDERSRICNICGEIFEHFIYLEEHLKSHAKSLTSENVEKKHICPVCNKGFKLSYYLKLHSFTHTKEKPIICQQCGKGFITRGKLNRHLETHTGVKKYQCHICCKFFTRPSYLRIHIRTIHGTQDYHFKHDGLNIGYSME